LSIRRAFAQTFTSLKDQLHYAADVGAVEILQETLLRVGAYFGPVNELLGVDALLNLRDNGGQMRASGDLRDVPMPQIRLDCQAH
jgi:hypothetical protein